MTKKPYLGGYRHKARGEFYASDQHRILSHTVNLGKLWPHRQLPAGAVYHHALTQTNIAGITAAQIADIIHHCQLVISRYALAGSYLQAAWIAF